MENRLDGTIVIPNDIFFGQVAESLSEGRNVVFTVKGYSMYPFFRNGKDRVCVTGYDGRELHRGEIILFRYRGKYLLHRIYGVERSPDGSLSYRTVGDGNIRGSESAVPRTVIGVAVKRVSPSGREWSCTSWTWKVFSALWMGLYFLRRWCLAFLRRVYR
ncbi:MAG: signal peptidase I [Bacteroidetes bacterium]|uniref:Signal peptidase I n=1 Tax=Candidatus Cryptobacteroides merdigallinarum TaxID=2840770 RepID=A0A9D9ELJ3_9BACT|nr:signal peptidase I [Candidatus Cryptobacteroides merdigallinarum]